MIYLLQTEPDDNGTLLVTCPAFPEVTTFAEAGPDQNGHVWRNGLAAIEEAIAARIADGDDIPAPASEGQIKKHRGVWVKLPLLTTLKTQLYTALRESPVETRAELARRLQWPREQVDRLFRLNHHSRTDQIEKAFAALGRDVEVRIDELAS